MKRIVVLSLLIVSGIGAFAQSCYWVFLTDKNGTAFDPYAYFDAKAIERYRQCGADLYDISNYPLNGGYVQQVCALATEEVGQSRWLNAVGVMATEAQADAIAQLGCVLRVQRIGGEMQLAQLKEASVPEADEWLVDGLSDKEAPELMDQLVRMQGAMFRDNGYDGTGVRIAVLDGGFPRVNTHAAFQHLRDGKRILDTWNFPNKKADVYGWNSHGLSTLSCIAGIVGDRQLGLATGAEYLLYRTEVELEPFKEEVWWMQGMERADQHGANIISSSLGYGKERYYTEDMDGTSYVAKAGNLAARKGILVCSSAGNEGDSKQWKTIVTPSDADSVLCVAGITSDLAEYEHIYFSSYGPAADGTMKPNVAAFGHAIAAVGKSDKAVNWVYGTSFSCPLVAGFAACAWQASPGKTAMEMFDLLQQSADHYPYFDYALGYGVPQASFFVEKEKKAVEPTFVFEDHDSCVYVRPTVTSDSFSYIFFNAQKADGELERYYEYALKKFNASTVFVFNKKNICYRTLNVCYEGYAGSYTMTKEESRKYAPNGEMEAFDYDILENTAFPNFQMGRSPEDNKVGKWGSNNKWRYDVYAQFGDMVRMGAENDAVSYWSPTARVGGRVMRAFCKSYCWGIGLEYGKSSFNLDETQRNGLDRLYGIAEDGSINSPSDKTYAMKEWTVEFFQRIRFVPGGKLTGKGLYWDLGFYISHINHSYTDTYDKYNYANSSVVSPAASMTFTNPVYLDRHQWNGGFTTRFGYDWISIYARYRFTGSLITYDYDPYAPTSFMMELPRLEVGIGISL